MTNPRDVRQLLGEIQAGDERKQVELLPLIYDELKVIAKRQLAGQRSDHTLQPTALVHEAWIKLAGSSSSQQSGSPRDDELQETKLLFMRQAATVMRNILVDHARKRGTQKRLPPGQRISLSEEAGIVSTDASFLLSLDESLTRLVKVDKRMAALVEMRCFGGLGLSEIAEALDLSLRQVERIWAAARTWLLSEFASE
ncbi:MAG: RNA polymerase sigma factor (TIGR02999 family) [Planctomycetota bacterium]|jgi:RNA polymerase sigma factor (TIGR02999 family)